MNTIPRETNVPPRTLFFRNAIAEILQHAASFGSHGLLLHGASLAASGHLQRILSNVPPALQLTTWQHHGDEPTLEQVDEVRNSPHFAHAEWIAAVGGGSVIDLAKACAALKNANQPASTFHDGQPLPGNGIPLLVAPTTAGTGSEATIVSVLTNTTTNVKKSFRHPDCMPRLVILDPTLLESCPRHVIAASGMDAFTQAVESFLSIHASWFTDSLAEKAATLLFNALPGVFANPSSHQTQELMLGSYLAGIALSNARLGLVHGLAHPLGARLHAPHGLVCAFCLPHVLDFNRSHSSPKYNQLSATIGCDLLQAAHHMLDLFKLQSPFTGHPLPDIQPIIHETLASGSTKANPRPVTPSDVESILRTLFRP